MQYQNNQNNPMIQGNQDGKSQLLNPVQNFPIFPPQINPNPQPIPSPQPYQTFQNQISSRTPQDFLYNNNYPNDNSLNPNYYYRENNNQYNFYNTQNNFRSFRRMHTFQRPTFQMPIAIPPSSEVLSYTNNVKEIERKREKENEKDKINLGKTNYI